MMCSSTLPDTSRHASTRAVSALEECFDANGRCPGGKALEWFPRLVGRSRAPEIVLCGHDFDAVISPRCDGWVNRTLDDDDCRLVC